MPLEPPFVFPSVVGGEDVLLSASTYVTFGQCPEQAGARMGGIYGPDSRASFVGGLAHRVFARHLNTGPIAADSFVAACREEIGAGMNHKLTSVGMRPSQLQGVIEDVSQLYDRFKTVSREGFAGAEVNLESQPVDGVTLRGAIDAVYDDSSGVRLVDWKTGSLGTPIDQLRFYALLWALDRGEIPSRLEAISVKTGERTEAVPSRAELDETAGRVANLIDTIRTTWATSEPLLRSAGPWCRWCPLLDECSEGRAANELLGR